MSASILRKIPGMLILLLAVMTGTAQDANPDKVYKSLEEALQNREQVYHLSLKKKKLEDFPVEVISLTNLKTLDLSKNKITRVPPLVGDLTNLEELNLTGNKIVTLPPEIGQLTKLKTLHVGMNELEYLPEEIGQLKQLQVLDIWSNNLEALPISISELSNLKSVDMRVIQLNTDEKQAIRDLLPETVNIRFSNSCDCD